MDDFEEELKQDFLMESTDLLADAESAFLRLESERESIDLLNEIFRLAHNLKGASKAVGFDQLSEVTHKAESLILKLKEGTLAVSDSVISVLLEFKDKVNEMVDGLKEDTEAQFDIGPIQEKLENYANGNFEDGVNTESTLEASEDKFEEDEDSLSQEDEIADPKMELDAEDEQVVEAQDEAQEPEGQSFTESFASTQESSEEDNVVGFPEPEHFDEEIDLSGYPDGDDDRFAESDDDSDEVQTEFFAEPEVNDSEEDSFSEPEVVPLSVAAEVSSAPEPEVAIKKEEPTPVPVKKDVAKKATGRKTEADESIRVNLSRIGKINNVIGELVILQTVISQRRYIYIGDDLTNKSIGMMGKLFKEVQDLAMSLRMLPLKSTFQKMNRIVRDTSKALDKQVSLVLIGEDTEVDKTVLEKLSDPLVHIIRNSVDHGIESKEERSKVDKPIVGVVELKAYHEGSNLVIEINDDGKGINAEVIKRKAIEKKVIAENQQLSHQEIIQLIFHPGFSTKEQVTEVSGRGVGMDVVRTNIESLGGEVKLSSVLGKGSSFKIVLPLTLAIIEGIVVSCEKQKYVIPMTQISEIIQVKPEQIESFSGVANLLRIRGEVMPLFNLRDKLGYKNKGEITETAIIVRGLSHSFGVLVDDILNQQQVVIKKLGEDVSNQKGIMGSAIMGDGMPSLILDLFDFFNSDLKSSEAYREMCSNRVAN